MNHGMAADGRLLSRGKAGKLYQGRGSDALRSQSALSQQIKALEDEFGSQLFERIGTRKLKLTPAGERFLEFSNRC